MDLSYFSHPRQDYHHKGKFDLSLDRIRVCLQELGSFHHHLPPIIHVAGTNGKCSTIAFMRSILERAGLKVHIFTSPHLIKVNERIILAGQEITDTDLMGLINRLAPFLKKHNLSWFESLTVLAFKAFHNVPADVVLLEVGLGGRYDATNVITPIASVITPISYDHIDYLGDSLSVIASAKAGIIKKNIPVFSAAQELEVQNILLDTVRNNMCSLSIQDRDWIIREGHQGWLLEMRGACVSLPYPQRLVGKHQLQNAALALVTLRSIYTYRIENRMAQQGVKDAYWPGRLMRLKNPKIIKPFAQGSEVWFDGAHNPAAVGAIRNYFSTHKSMPLYVVCGLLKSKDAQAFIEGLQPITDQFIFVPIPNHPYCYSVEELLHYEKTALTAQSIQEAFSVIVQRLQHKPATILICGSFYLAQEILEQA